MEVSPRDFKFRTIIDWFTWDLLLILYESLTQDDLDSEHVKLRILMTLSDVADSKPSSDTSPAVTLSRTNRHSYVTELLFRDYSKPRDQLWHRFNLPATDHRPAHTIQIHDEAITFLSSVLERRLTLAQNLKDKPTNLHQLFTALASHSRLHTDWNSVRVIREHDVQANNIEHNYFSQCAQQLELLIKQLGNNYSDISKRRREQYGPLWLIVNDCQTELPEEFSLFAVLDALPLALEPEFCIDQNVQKLLNRSVDALNERYKLLRSVGLTPQTWLERDYPSIAVLRDLKQLRTDSEAVLRCGQNNSLVSAYRHVFNEKLKSRQGKKFAGCNNFEAFAQTDFGQTLLKYSTLSLDQPIQDSGEPCTLSDVIPGTEFEDDLLHATFEQFDNDLDWVNYLINTRPELFDDVMRVFFQETIVLDQSLEGQTNDLPVLKNSHFKQLIRRHPLYQSLTGEQLVDRLMEQAQHIIEQGMRLADTEQLHVG